MLIALSASSRTRIHEVLRAFGVAGLFVLTAGCPAQTGSVTLTLFTDFEPGAQILRAHYDFTAEGETAPTIEGDLRISDFAPGERMFSATTGRLAFAPGPHAYAVTLITAEGPVRATGRNPFTGAGAHRVQLTITRSDCEGVVGCDDDETCLCGACYPEACRSDPSGTDCPGSCCRDAGGCEEPPAPCATAFCTGSGGDGEEGRCAWETRAGACGADEWCDGRVGCVPLARLHDAGAADGGAVDGGRGDAAVDAGDGPADVGSPDAPDACECMPGAIGTATCGSCGEQSRTCQLDCTWGAFGACTGEGCVPGTRVGRSCMCGTEYSYCRDDCTWGSYRDCPGPSCLDVSGARTVCAGARGRVQCGTGGLFRDCLCTTAGWTDCGFCE